ncbi:hypothetical protein [Marinobacter sp. SS21]|uniref:hypothetical protein n=1 Tax=Marinobacter sp. SS21 TaxID=2979460 RepID=UPI00232DFA8F|nr:hypothetical protein [Marinobacter sp. SS21]MDC0661213.1 hypothetical protein [Marinobacter sp. SS21]
MPIFNIESKLRVEASSLSRDLFTMEAVNRELAPLLRMSAPDEWRQRPISSWPTGVRLFKSVISLFGLIPSDVHQFLFEEVGDLGFRESSTSLMNKTWRHQRQIIPAGNAAIVRDTVEFSNRFRPMGVALKPVYERVFKRRHRYLRSTYGAIGD